VALPNFLSFLRGGKRGGNPYNRRNPDTFIPRYTSPPRRNTYEWIEYFSQSPRLAVIDRISTDLAEVPGKLFKIMPDGTERQLEKHPFLDLLDHCNPLHEFTPTAMWRLHQIYLELTGEAAMLIERDEVGEPTELWSVPPHWIMQTPYLGNPYYMIRTPQGGIIQVPVDDMFIQKDLNPFDPYMRGMGHAQGIADEVETDEYAAKFQKAFFYNDATPRTIVQMPNSTPEQRQRVQSKWEEKLRGAGNSHKTHVIDGTVTVTTVGDTMNDIQMVEGRRFLRDAVLEHFNVPREIMGITESSNRATSEAAQFIYTQNVLMPRLRARQTAINLQLLISFGDDLVFRFDDIVPHDKEFDRLTSIDGWNNGLLTKNQALELQGLSTIGPAGDVYRSDLSAVFYRSKEDPAEVFKPASSASFGGFSLEESLKNILKGYSEKKNNADTTPDIWQSQLPDADVALITAAAVLPPQANAGQVDTRVANAVVRSVDIAVEDNARAISRELDKYFRKQSELVERALGSVSESVLRALKTDEDYLKFVQGLVDWDREAQILFNSLTPLLERSLSTGKGIAVELYGVSDKVIGGMLTDLNPLQRIAGITKTTQELIAVQLRDGIGGGLLMPDITANAREVVGENPERVKMIADTEARTAVTTSQYRAAAQGGYNAKRWVAHGDGITRPSHRVANGQTRLSNEPFDVGGHKLMHPGDPSAPLSETMGCRCIEIPVRLTEEELTRIRR
jgi:HK97 family phage portal protein